MREYLTQVNEVMMKMFEKVKEYEEALGQAEAEHPLTKKEKGFRAEFKRYQTIYPFKRITTILTREEHYVWLGLWIDMLKDFEGEDVESADTALTILYTMEYVMDVALGERDGIGYPRKLPSYK
ncbi:hypothetical protein [Rossellomorea marisflavi]|uniref:hypothetical protein n=1 Tax=Rossellomorea marisflavi TaxID=189381 RepID=UPI003F9FE43E